MCVCVCHDLAKVADATCTDRPYLRRTFPRIDRTIPSRLIMPYSTKSGEDEEKRTRFKRERPALRIEISKTKLRLCSAGAQGPPMKI